MRFHVLWNSDCKFFPGSFIFPSSSNLLSKSARAPAILPRPKCVNAVNTFSSLRLICRIARGDINRSCDGDKMKESIKINRRLACLLCSFLLGGSIDDHDKALAVKQTLLAGRVPGLSPPDENGRRTYHRPDTKSGGHGIGWSPIIPYSFTVSPGWEEVPVSIADLGGTEIDLRFVNKKEGNLSIVVAPILRFADNDSATIEEIGPPEKVIYAFGPEVVGQNVEGRVKSAEVTEQAGRKYYHYEVEAPHALITATAAGNRLYLMTVSANGLQWKKHFPNLKMIADSFRVDS